MLWSAKKGKLLGWPRPIGAKPVRHISGPKLCSNLGLTKNTELQHLATGNVRART